MHGLRSGNSLVPSKAKGGNWMCTELDHPFWFLRAKIVIGVRADVLPGLGSCANTLAQQCPSHPLRHRRGRPTPHFSSPPSTPPMSTCQLVENSCFTKWLSLSSKVDV